MPDSDNLPVPHVRNQVPHVQDATSPRSRPHTNRSHRDPRHRDRPRRYWTVPRPRLGRAFGSLQHPVFRWWFASQVLSASGTMTQAVAQSWLVLKLTGSGVELGLMSSCLFLPLLIGGPFAGVLVDRSERRHLLVTTQILLIILATVLAVLTATGAIQLWMIFLIAAITGTVASIDGAARQVYEIELVGPGQVASAISLNEVVLNASRILGPAAGGALLAAFGVSACCVLNAASYLPPLAVLLICGKAGQASRGGSVPAERERQFLPGLRYALGNPAIRACLLMAAVSGMLFELNVPLPLLATRTFHLSPGGFGLMMAIFGIGAMPGAMIAASSGGKPTGRTVGALAISTAVAVLATSSAPDAALCFCGLGVTGFLSIWFIARASTLVQLESAPELRGRVSSAWNMALPGTVPLTSPFVGWVGGTVGAREGFGVGGVALMFTAVLGWRGLTAHARPLDRDIEFRESAQL